MAQPVKHDPKVVPPSPHRPVSDPTIDLVAQHAARARMEQAGAAPAPLVGSDPAKYDFPAKIAEAYGEKQARNFQRAKTLFLEILEQANSSDCPAEFAKYSLFYVNCLVGLAETWEAPGESFAYAKQVLHQIDYILAKPIEKPAIYPTLLKYVKRVENFVSSDTNYKSNCTYLIKALEGKCPKENPVEAPQAHPAAPKEARKVTPTDPSKGSSTTNRLFFLFVGLLLIAGVATLYRRHIIQISSSSK